MVLANNFKPYVCTKHDYIGTPSRCRKCRSEARNALNAGKPDGRAKNLILSENGRNCMKCGEMKSWDMFITDNHGYNNKTATCTPCRREKHREAYKNNPAVRRSGLKNRPDKVMRLYGITYEEAVQTLANQFGRCANTGCSKEITFDAKGNTREKAVIDHCHASGKFRAILCSKCNLDLGMLETDEPRFLGLMAYKAKYNYKGRK